VKSYSRRFIFCSFFFVLIAALVGCGNGISQRNTNRLVVGMEGDAVSLDPHASNITISSQYKVQMFETLINLDKDGNAIGVLANDWRRIDDYTYEFDLKEGVYFHNGEEMIAEDVAFSIRRAASSPQVAAIMGDFDPEGVEVVDQYTVRIRTHEPFAPFLNNLAHPAAAVLSQLAVEYYGDENFGHNPVGTGPFEFVNWVAGNHVEFIRFENYHGELPVFETLIMRSMIEPSTRLVSLETGDIDIAIIGRNDMNRVKNHNDLNLERLINYQIFYVGFNTRRNRMDDVRIRQAINYAINVDEIHETVMLGVGETLSSPLTSNVFGARTDLPPHPFNQERARELLAQAGYADGFTANLIVNEFPERNEWAEIVQNQLGQVGIKIEITSVDNAQFLDETAEGNYDMFVLAWTSVTGDADYGLFPLFHSSNHGAPGNRTFFNDPEMDDLLERARSSFDNEERIELYDEIQERLVEAAPMVLLASGEIMAGVRNDVRNVNLAPTNHVRFHTVTFD